MASPSTFLVFGASGGSGKHFVAKALSEGHRVRAFVRNPAKVTTQHVNLKVIQGSITTITNMDELVQGADYVVVMVGDRVAQNEAKICTPFVKELIPAMRRHGVKRLLYQAGGFSKPYGKSLGPVLWVMRNTIARLYNGQHEDNEAVMEYLATQAMDIEWMVHRAAIGGDGPSKGRLERSSSSIGIGCHRDCADYSYRTIVHDAPAVHTSDFSQYAKS